MNITVFRVRFHETRTVGQLYIDGDLFCFTLEDKVREVKVQDETAIPEGKYRVVLENSPKFGPDTITLRDVPNFTKIRVHAGNTEHHTEGCLIVGYRLNDDGTIKFGTTRPAVRDLKTKIKEAIDSGQKVFITIARGR
jgi:hypothetical protein